MTLTYFPFGAPVYPLISVLSYQQKTRNTVDIVFDDEPQNIDPIDPDDSLYELNYTTTVTGTELDDPIRLIQYIEYIGDNTIRLWYDGALVTDGDYSISITGIRGDSGSFLSPDPTVITFNAFGLSRKSREPLLPEQVSIDIANPQLFSQAGQDQSLATFQIDDDGDFENDRGRPSLKKRIIRRAITQTGGFLHLPDYGLGFKKGSLLTTTELRRIQLTAESQARKEPEVLEAVALISQPTPGVVRLVWRIKDNLGLFEMSAEQDLREQDV
jgi:hypothetical protein